MQFVRNHRYPDGSRHTSYQIHTPVLSKNGVMLLNAQVKKKSLQTINQQQISYEPDWTLKFINLFDEHYRKAPYYDFIRDDIADLLSERYQSLAELNIRTTVWALCRLLDTPFDRGVKLDQINATLAKLPACTLNSLHLGSESFESTDSDKSATDRILQLCKRYECNAYIAGGTAIDSYFELDKFRVEDVAVCRQNWHCAEYEQSRSGSAAFEPNLSVVDLLANAPHEEAFEIVNRNFTLDVE